MKTRDPWSRTIAMMRASWDGTTPVVPVKANRNGQGAFGDSLVISVVDRPTASTATLYWRDATRCCYPDQAWRAAVARRTGHCAMSGLPIKRGDAIYVPRRSATVSNAHAMILTSELERRTMGVRASP
ncbi:DUF3331 domain-containing protein [Caballeronia sp. LZ016]|uniref:DUF3331 domain-containing protein n=1 Tax=Caballeronia sp. LZ016 TaxID=3038554 RepID=UPI00285FFD5C|nr:DUF3331 domain-containing protein [Caballeronia sp. LZ016]MDR5740111.1 DUF3331 domain-containing protein [Caballeronia sp. LZ016]